MISDFSNSNIPNINPEATGVRAQNQQPVSPAQQIAQKSLNANPEALKFPSNEEITESVELALAQNQAPQRGSIVNILA